MRCVSVRGHISERACVIVQEGVWECLGNWGWIRRESLLVQGGVRLCRYERVRWCRRVCWFVCRYECVYCMRECVSPNTSQWSSQSMSPNSRSSGPVGPVCLWESVQCKGVVVIRRGFVNERAMMGCVRRDRQGRWALCVCERKCALWKVYYVAPRYVRVKGGPRSRCMLL